MNDIRQAAAEKRSFTKAGRERQVRDGRAGLKVRVEDNLDDGKDAAGLEGTEQFGKSGGAVGNLSEDGDQNSAIKAAGREHAVSESGGKELDVRVPCGFRLGFGSGKHPRLNVQSYDSPGRANASGEGRRQTPGTAPGVQHRHAGREGDRFDDERGSVRLREWIVQLHEPAQPDRTGDASAPRREPPDERGDKERDDARKEDVRESHNLWSPAAATRWEAAPRRLRSSFLQGSYDAMKRAVFSHPRACARRIADRELLSPLFHIINSPFLRPREGKDLRNRSASISPPALSLFGILVQALLHPDHIPVLYSVFDNLFRTAPLLKWLLKKLPGFFREIRQAFAIGLCAVK